MKLFHSLLPAVLLATLAACSCQNTGESLTQDRTEVCLNKGFVMGTPDYNACLQTGTTRNELQQLRNTVPPRSLQGL
ncbi:MAG: hypothetical protein U1E36_09440 [Rickettsiales bacterium]